MMAINFLADSAVTGTVAGLSLGASQARICQVLGDTYGADRRRKSLRLDYGLLEFGLYAGSCETIALQVHRLASGSYDLVPPVLRVYFEDFPGRVRFEDLRNKIEERGDLFLEELQKQHGYRNYRVGGSHVNLYVVDVDAREGGVLVPGDLWSIHISGRG